MAESRERVTYFNGRIIPRSQAMEELQRDDMRSAGGFYDHERTFNRKVFRLREHLERLYRGLAFSRIDPGMSLEEMETIALDNLEANLPLLPDGDEFEVTQVVSLSPTKSPHEKPRVNVVMYCEPLDFASFAISYVKGVHVVTPSTYAVRTQSPSSVARHDEQRVLPLMTGRDGSITECKGGNFMFVRDGRIKLPDRRNVLPGVTMQTVLEIAAVLKIDVDEGAYSISDVYMASEAFVSATISIVQPVHTINGYRLGDELPGPLTRRIMDAWRELVGLDFVQQALAHLPDQSPDQSKDASAEGNSPLDP